MTVITAAKVLWLGYTLLLYFPSSIAWENLVTSSNDVTIICSINLVGKPLHMCRRTAIVCLCIRRCPRQLKRKWRRFRTSSSLFQTVFHACDIYYYYRLAPGFHTAHCPSPQWVVNSLVSVKHWPMWSLVDMLCNSSLQYQGNSSPIANVVLALDSWKCCSGEQSLTTARHIHLHVCLLWLHWIRRRKPPYFLYFPLYTLFSFVKKIL